MSSRGINKVILVGNVGGDPEVRYSPNGTAFANITLATSESWKDKQTGQQQERTEWHRVVFSGKLAEIVGQYVTKGQQLYVEGKLATRKWQDKDGQDRYTTEIQVGVNGQMQMLGAKGEGQPAQQPRQQPATQQRQQQSQQAAPPDSFDDDIPFRAWHSLNSI